MAEAKPFESWALVELFGHNRIAGLVTEAEIGGGKFIRVDVPAIGEARPLTKLYGPAAIYAITPLEKDTALALAKRIDPAPVQAWDAKHLLGLVEKQQSQRSISAPDNDGETDDDICF